MKTTKGLAAIPRVESQGRAWMVQLSTVGVLLLAASVLLGCAEPLTIAAIEPTATAYAPPPTDIPPPPPGPTPAALDFPLAAPTREEAQIVDDQTCVDCHTDEETLRAMAEEEEAPAVESEGEG